MMEKIAFTFLVCSRFTIVFSDKYKILPPLYHVENYVTCMQANNSYCKVDVKLKNLGSESNIFWKLIEESIRDTHSCDRNVIHRAICLPKQVTDLESIKEFILLHINEELNGTNLFPYLEDIICKSNDIKLSSYDVLLVIFFLAYLSLVLYATIHERRKKNGITEIRSTRDKLLISFSIISNWKKVFKIPENEDFKKLKSIQGIRFYIMLAILVCHTIHGFSLVYISNPESIAQLNKNIIMNFSFVLVMFLVQTFILISSWIVTFQIYNIRRNYGEFTAKQAAIILVNRFFRFGVCSTIMMLILRSSWYRLLDGPITFDNHHAFQRACTQNWWQTFFFVNNYLKFIEVCNPMSWYLSVDFQLHAVTILTLYIILKYNLNELKVLCILLFCSCVLYGTVIYINSMDIIFRLNSKSMRAYNFYNSTQFIILHMSTYSSWSASIFGTIFGIIYTKNKNRNVTKSKVLSALWFLIFIGLPCLIIIIAQHNFKGIAAAILGPIVKPLYLLGTGIGILGMSHGVGGFLKRTFENKYVVLMSNFSFSTYIFQLLITFSKGHGSYSLVEFVSILKLIRYSLFVDIPLCLLIGIIGTFLFEQPGVNLHNMLFRQFLCRSQPQKDK